MTETANFLAIDLGASSGRVILGRWDGAHIDLRELHRFGNDPVIVRGHMHWDVLRLWHEIKSGIARYSAEFNAPLAGIGIDTWAIDFGLLDAAGELLGTPYHYRDRRNTGIAEIVDGQVPAKQLYALTGIQRLPFNTIYQLVSMRLNRDPQLDAARTLLLIPDLLGYWLTGRAVAEYTNATTTQLCDAKTGQWAVDLLAELELPSAILPQIVMPGTLLGEMLPEVRDEVGLRHRTPVIATATHDTASAVAGVPGLDSASIYISSGTWSLVGVELQEPVLSERARALNFTNEGGVGGTIRFLKNVGGLWLLQECQRAWQREGNNSQKGTLYNWTDLLALAAGADAAAAPLQSLVDPDAPDFLNPPNMPAAIRQYCRQSGQAEPDSAGEVVRCCLESIALKYRWSLTALEELTGRKLETIHIVGGGSQNEVLCQLTADACKRTVVAGPVEATALGNILVQAIATGHLPDLAAGRQAVASSVQQTTFTPQARVDWDAAMARFARLVEATNGR